MEGSFLLKDFREEKYRADIKEVIHYIAQPRTWFQALIGLSVMEVFFRLAPKFRLSRLDYFTLNGTFFLPPGPKASVLGATMFYSGAVVWVSLFRFLKPRMKGSPVMRPLKYGTMIFLISSFVVMPLAGLINPQIRRGILKKPGVLGLKLDGWKTAFTNLLGHVVFGYVIGARKS